MIPIEGILPQSACRDFATLRMHNSAMKLLGRVHNGVVVLDEGTVLPEGTRVSVSPVPSQPIETEIVLIPGELPYIRGGAPGTRKLTNERIAEIFEEEDIGAMTKGMRNVPS